MQDCQFLRTIIMRVIFLFVQCCWSWSLTTTNNTATTTLQR